MEDTSYRLSIKSAVRSEGSLIDMRKFETNMPKSAEAQKIILKTFLEQTPILIADLRSTLNALEEKKTFKLVHKLKSSVSIFCSDEFFDAIREMELGTIRIQSPEFHCMGKRLIQRVEKLLQETQTIFDKMTKAI